MKKAEQRQYLWLQFQKTNHNFTVSRTEAYGRGATDMPIPLGDWDEASTKLEQAGFGRSESLR